MKRDKWTQQLHDKLAEHETPAPADLWADIEAALPQQPRRSRFVALRRWAVAASVAVLLGGGAMVWWNTLSRETLPQSLPRGRGVDRHSNDLSYGENQKVGEQDEMPMDEELSDANLQGAATSLPARGGAGGGVSNFSQSVIAQAEMPIEAERAGTTEGTEMPIETGTTERTEMPIKTESTEKAQTPPPTPPLDGRGVAAPRKSAEELTTPLPHREGPVEGLQGFHARHVQLGLYAMNGFGPEDNSNAVQMADALVKSYADTYAASQAASRQSPVYLTGYEERQHHQQPVGFGLSLSYPLTGRLSLASGIVYTRLESEFTQVIRSQQIHRDQQLHYVGIPLSISYRLWQKGGLRAYLSLGLQADWNVKARLKTEGVDQETCLDRLQWSVGGSLGLQYDLLPQLSLYAEPGINHYFDNGSMVQNFFKDKPTSLKLQLGIRFSLQ